MKARILKDFDDKITKKPMSAGRIVDFEDKRAKALESLGFVKILEVAPVQPKKEVAEEKKPSPKKATKKK